MQRVFIETKYKGNLSLPKKLIERLPEKIVLAMPVQFLDFLDEIKKQLESAGKKVVLFKSKHGKYPGQALGCAIEKFAGDYEAFLYIGDGKFHPTALLYENEKEVYCYNPFNDQIEILDSSDLEKVLKRKKGQLAKFLSSDNIGILVTSKFGQNRSKKAEELREKLEKVDKKAFVFMADEINFNSLENFNFIDVWINTACPRIVDDFKCLNLRDLAEIGF
jgi:2-(3-amino-3-carboxypropyl)histidine synthase